MAFIVVTLILVALVIYCCRRHHMNSLQKHKIGVMQNTRLP